MLQALREKVGSLIAKIILVLLVGSFALWGVADYVAPPEHSNIAAEVDGEVISIQELSQAYQRDLAGTALGRLDAEVQRSLRLAETSLDRLINQRLLQNEAERRGLYIGDQALLTLIQADARFKAQDGTFSRRAFENYLTNSGLSEAAYLQQLGQDFIIRQLIGTVAPASPPPRYLGQALFQNQAATRDVTLVTLNADDGVQFEANEAELDQFYQENQENFRRMEQRLTSFLWLSVPRLMPSIQMDDALLLDYYTQNKREFTTPEQRDLTQIRLNAGDDEAAIVKALQQDQSIEAIIEAGLITRDQVNALGTVTQGELPDPSIDEAAFALSSVGVTGVIDGLLAKVIIKVEAITAEKIDPFDQVQAGIRNRLTAIEAERQLPELIDLIEDGLGQGQSLEEVARTLDLDVEQTKINRQGLDENGQAVTLPQALFLPEIFSLNAQETGFPIQNDQGEVFVARVDSVEASHIPALEEIKTEVQAAYNQRQVEIALQTEAEALISETKEQGNIANLANQKGLEVTRFAALSREGAASEGQITDRGLLDFIFSLKPNQPALRPSPNADNQTSNFYVAEVTKLYPANRDQQPELYQQVTDGLANQLTELRFRAYLNHLRETIGVTTHQAVIDRLYQY